MRNCGARDHDNCKARTRPDDNSSASSTVRCDDDTADDCSARHNCGAHNYCGSDDDGGTNYDGCADDNHH